MLIAKRSILRNYSKEKKVTRALEVLEKSIEKHNWLNPHELKATYPKASVVGGKNAIFDILHGRFRVWVKVNYASQIVAIHKIGTHEEYDKWIII